MSMPDVIIDVDEHEVLAATSALDLATSQAGFLKWLNDHALDLLVKRADERFLDEGDDASGKWEDLKPATEDIREGLGYPRSHPINVRSGKLEDWLLNSPGTIRMKGNKSAELVWPGPAPLRDEIIDKFEVAQVGLSFPATVARPVAVINETDLFLMLESMRDFITDFVAGYVSSAFPTGAP